MHISKTHVGINSIDHEIHYAGKYGQKGEKRAARKKATPEEMRRVNQLNKERRLWHLLTANFYPNDIWVTLKYQAGTRKTSEEVKKDWEIFRRRMKNDYKKLGEEFKFIARREIGKHGGAHIHILVNRIVMAELLIQKNWVTDLVHMEPCYADGDMKDLASYLAKPLPQDEDCGEDSQLALMDMDEQSEYAAYNTSRNLIRPEPEVKRYTKRTVRKLIEEGPKPKDGYYIDKNSVRTGINPYTGYSYMYYTEIRIKPILRTIRQHEDVCLTRGRRKKTGG